MPFFSATHVSKGQATSTIKHTLPSFSSTTISGYDDYDDDVDYYYYHFIITTGIPRLHRLFKSLDTFLDIVNHVYLQVCGLPFLHITTVATVCREKFLGKVLEPLD